jgi:hypothetical protein
MKDTIISKVRQRKTFHDLTYIWNVKKTSQIHRVRKLNNDHHGWGWEEDKQKMNLFRNLTYNMRAKVNETTIYWRFLVNE